MKLSIIIPIYNVESYLKRCLDSIVNQNSNNIEVIMINDGSTDNGPIIAEQYSRQYENFYLINQENKGLSGARNTGISASKGDYLWFVDSDDYIANDAVDKILDAIEVAKADIIATNVVVVTTSNGKEKIEQVKRYNLKSGFVPSWSFYKNGYIPPFSGAPFYIVKKEFLALNKISFKEGIYFEDLLYTPTILSCCDECYYLDECPYIYFIREGSITTTALSIKKCEDVLTVADTLFERYTSNTKVAGKKILLSSILKIVSFYYPNYFCKVKKQDRNMARKLYLSHGYFQKLLCKSWNPKYLISYIEILLGWSYPLRRIIKRLF